MLLRIYVTNIIDKYIRGSRLSNLMYLIYKFSDYTIGTDLMKDWRMYDIKFFRPVQESRTQFVPKRVYRRNTLEQTSALIMTLLPEMMHLLLYLRAMQQKCI